MTVQLPQEHYRLWCESITDVDLRNELKSLSKDDVMERFSNHLTFGTGGLRGRMGVGTSRMNIYIVAQTTQGIADAVICGRVVVAYDSRLRSKLFAETVAHVFAANGFDVYLFDRLMPTPILSFAVRELAATLGIVITASHNPKHDNGYKVYNADGCQIGLEQAEIFEQAIQKVRIFKDVRWEGGFVKTVPEALLQSYYDKLSIPYLANLHVVYTPLNGAGREPVGEVLGRTGLSLSWVAAQAEPDGHFSTCPYPNPELPEALTLGIEQMKLCGADALLATDPDCDRVGVAVPIAGGCRILNGNELGVLLLDYLCQTRPIPPDAMVVKTFVTTDMAKAIAKRYGLSCFEVPVGFKYIGECIGKLEQCGCIERYFFGLEESCGYLPITFVRDKDGVSTSLLVCEMAAWHKFNGRTLSEALDALYAMHGHYRTSQKSHVFEGIEGIGKRKSIMDSFRKYGIEGFVMEDFSLRSEYACDMLRFMRNENTIVVRPSGTEPKIKLYFSACGSSAIEAEDYLQGLEQETDGWTGACKYNGS